MDGESLFENERLEMKWALKKRILAMEISSKMAFQKNKERKQKELQERLKRATVNEKETERTELPRGTESYTSIEHAVESTSTAEVKEISTSEKKEEIPRRTRWEICIATRYSESSSELYLYEEEECNER